jgi:putative endonuclease
MFWTYVIYSTKNDIYYIWQTNNLTDRLLRHNTNRNKYTKNKGPWKLVFSKEFATRSQAMAFEKKLKSFKNPKKISNVIYRWLKQCILKKTYTLGNLFRTLCPLSL